MLDQMQMLKSKITNAISELTMPSAHSTFTLLEIITKLAIKADNDATHTHPMDRESPQSSSLEANAYATAGITTSAQTWVRIIAKIGHDSLFSVLGQTVASTYTPYNSIDKTI